MKAFSFKIPKIDKQSIIVQNDKLDHLSDRLPNFKNDFLELKSMHSFDRIQSFLTLMQNSPEELIEIGKNNMLGVNTKVQCFLLAMI